MRSEKLTCALAGFAFVMVGVVGVGVVAVGGVALAAEPVPDDAFQPMPPMDPQASLRAIHVRDGFTVELVAAEPLVMDPVAYAWGGDGRLWVVEMADYPLGIDNKGTPGGRVVYLQDSDGDGKFDRRTVFLDGLNFPTGVMPWRKGVLVSAAPTVFYAEDSDGDGKADVRRTLYVGFGEGNQQHRVNGLRWGLDNWVYLGNGESAGTIKSQKTGQVVNISGRDLRIRPDEGLLDPQSGQTQFGRNRDDWGNWFGGNNSNPMWHYALNDDYTRRNALFAAPDPRVQVSVTPGNAPVFPASRTMERFNDLYTANRFTSACSPIVYRDNLLGPAFAGNSFVCEPVHNLVHREIMSTRGVTFTSHRPDDEQTSEFLASKDNWFRPTMVRTGPDGALWISDMYRLVIEHPKWIPLAFQKKYDGRAGSDRGRIYRVYPTGTKPRPIPQLAKGDTAALVEALTSPNGYVRDLAHQMLLWRGDKSAAPLLRQLASAGQPATARLHALCVLDGLDALNADVLARALADEHPGVRRHAVRLCEGRTIAAPRLVAALVSLVDDADPFVRQQLAYTLGEVDDPRAGAALGRLLLKDHDDRYQFAAAMSSLTGKVDQVITTVLKSPATGPDAGAAARGDLLANLIGLAIAANDQKSIAAVVNAVAAGPGEKVASWQFTALARMLDALDRHRTTLSQFTATAGDDVKAAVKRLDTLFAAARTAAGDGRIPLADRISAIDLLGRGAGDAAGDLAALSAMLTPQSPFELQAAAVTSIGRLRDDTVPAALLAGWKSHSPQLRNAVLDVLLRRPAWAASLLDAVARGAVRPADLDVPRQRLLLESKSADVRQRAAALFTGKAKGTRQQVIEQFRPVLTMTGDAARGKAAFEKTCAACHQLGGVGRATGPDLRSLTDRSPQAMLTAVLDPNRAVETRFISYLAATRDGQTFIGMLTGETGNSITMVGVDGAQRTILRADLDELRSTDLSLMPEGLERTLGPKDLADLFAFIAESGPPRKTFANNAPRIIKADNDGKLSLPADAAEIYGPSIIFEQQYRNLGYWQNAADHAVWTVEAPKAGVYTVWLRWAVQTDSAGNHFKISTAGSTLTGTVPSTGNWDTYKRLPFGRIELKAGRHQLNVQPAGPIKGALFDLRQIELVPLAGR